VSWSHHRIQRLDRPNGFPAGSRGVALRQPQCTVRLPPRAGSSRGVNGGNRSAARQAGQTPRR
jgi:hypothetical protein